MIQNIHSRLASAIEAVLERSDEMNDISIQARNEIVAACVGQLADIVGYALAPFDTKSGTLADQAFGSAILEALDLMPVQLTMTASQVNRLVMLRRMVAGKMGTVPPRRFFLCKVERGDEVTVTFCRFEAEKFAKSELDLTSFDVLDPAWPEVRVVLETLEQAIEQAQAGD